MIRVKGKRGYIPPGQRYAQGVTRACANPGCRQPFHPYVRCIKNQKICGAPGCRAWVALVYKHRADATVDRGKYMERAELTAFLKAAKQYGPYWYWFFKLAVDACLRAGEVGRITLGSFCMDSDPPVLNVVTFKRKGQPTLPVDIPKATAQGALAWARQHRMGVGPDAPIWPTTKQYAWQIFKRVCRAAKLRDYKLHSLRHTGIMLRAAAARSVEDLEWLRRSARHGDIKVTALYLHTTAARRKALMGRVRFAD